MITKIIGNKEGQPVAYYDLRDGFRMGDLACLRAILADWRRLYPDRRLYIIWNKHHKISHYGNFLPMEWVVGDIADEIWETEIEGEDLRVPGGEDIRTTHHWDEWTKLRYSRAVSPTLPPPEYSIDKSREFRKQNGLPEKYIAYQPLFDAGYHLYRNGKIVWWEQLLEKLSKRVPVLTLCHHEFKDKFKIPKEAFSTMPGMVNPLTSLGLVYDSSLMVGGETGMPLWACLFKKPVVAVFRQWTLYSDVERGSSLYDYCPIDFEAPVIHAPLEGQIDMVANIIVDAFEGKLPSTPIQSIISRIAGGKHTSRGGNSRTANIQKNKYVHTRRITRRR